MGLPNEWLDHPRVRHALDKQAANALVTGRAMSAELLAAAEATLRKAPRAKRIGGFDSKGEAARWYEWHVPRVESGLVAAVLRQPMLDLPGGLRYRADFLEIGIEEMGGGHRLAFEEFKGSRKSKNARDSLTRLRIAAGLYLWAEFRIVERERGGCWKVEVL